MHLHPTLLSLIFSGLLALASAFVPRGDSGEARGQDRATSRKLLYPAKVEDVPKRLRPCVASLLSCDQRPVEGSVAKAAGVFARVVTRKNVLDGNALKVGSTLGTRPFVFVTLPEGLVGRSLLQVFSTIGYSAEEVLTGQLGEEKVVVVFRWDEKVVLHEGRDGKLPEAWQTAIYPATWDNLFSVVEKMASDRDWHCLQKKDRRQVMKLELQSPREVHFVLGYPSAGKERIKSSTYYALREVKGADWEYRSLLDRTMSASEHYSGDGTSKPTITAQGKVPSGFPEFIGPNRELTTFPELAVVGLGALRIGEK